MSPGETPGCDPAERSRLERGTVALGLALGEADLERLLGHVALIRHWSRSYNLVSRSDLRSLVVRHTLDSLAVQPFLAGERLLDVGSGAGFPGVPLAIARPALEVTLLDAAGKRVRFLNHVVRELGLDNVRVVHARVERCSLGQAFDTVCSRAFASLSDFAQAVRGVTGPVTRVLAIKGRHPTGELRKLPSWVTVTAVSQYHVPLLEAERHAVIMTLAPDPANEAA